MNSFELIIAVLISICVLIFILYLVLKSPFCFPYFEYSFDVSGKRKPEVEDLIDNFLINGEFSRIQNHSEIIQRWKVECENKIHRSKLKKYRTNQYQKCLDDENAFQFSLTRQQTRYRQQNYIKQSYKVTETVSKFTCDYTYLLERDKHLKAINYECTLRAYQSKEQRKLMTRELRRKVILRDDYTCRLCGKYMPDGVGLHVDHIIPVSKGGKTVLSNLQVLCSKCNGRKSNKI